MAYSPPHAGFADRFRSPEVMLGLISFTQSEVIIEAMARAGMDFVIIDTEHAPTSLETVARLIRAADAAGIPPLVRFGYVDRHQIQIALDAGAVGIAISNIDDPEAVRELVRATQFQPSGDRGVCPMARSGQFAATDWADVMERQNRSVVTLALIESAAGVERIEEIAGVPGLDAVFLGPGDLSVSLGIPYRDFRDPTMAAALDRTIQAAQSSGLRVVTSAAHRIDHSYAAELLSRGVNTLSFSTDNMIFYAACQQIVALKDAPQGG